MDSKTLEELKKQLDANIPDDAVSKRSQSGQSLSYLEGWYVIDRLNQVLGQGSWQYETEQLTKTHDTVFEKNGRSGRAVSYMATVRLTADIGERTVSFSDVGAGKGIDYSATGTDADESAAKEAVTDGLKRCAKNLGRSLGLALYDKERRYVGDAEETAKADPQPGPSVAASPPKSDTLAQGRVRSTYNVLLGKKKITKEDFQSKYLAPLKREKVADLTDTEAKEVLSKLQSDYKEILNAR